MRKHLKSIVLCFLILYVIVNADSYIHAKITGSRRHTHPDAYRNPRFWDEEIGYCFVRQETLNSCGPASVQMVLKYLDVSPLPSQSELASEMNTTVYEYTYRTFMHIPFVKRGFEKYLSTFLSRDFERALDNLKGNVSKNFPVIILTWYGAQHKVGHYRIVTGYNSTGIFVHDPTMGPNIFFNNTILRDLWYYSRFWALIILEQPHFDLTVKVRNFFDFPISGVKITIANGKEIALTTDQNGTAKFSGLSLGEYRLEYSSKFESGEDIIVLTKTMSVEYVIIFSDLTVSIFFIIAILLLIMLMLLARWNLF